MRAELFGWAVRGAGVAIGVAVVVGIIALGAAASSLLLLLFAAVLLASALEPVVGWIRGRTPLGRGAAILVVYAAFLATVVAFVLVVVPAAFNQFQQIQANLPPLLETARSWAGSLQPGGLATSVTALIDSLGNTLAPPPPDPDEVVEVGLTVAEIGVSIATLLAVVFFWLVEHARLQRFTLAFLPARRRPGTREAWNEIETRLGGWVRGQLILMASVGVASAIILSLLGVPSSLLLGLIAGITEVIPIIGPVLGAVPAVLVAATVSPQLALIVAGIYVVIQIVEGNVLVPLVMRNTIGVSPFVVIVSLLLGAAVGGPLGAILGVPIVAAVLVVLERLQARRVRVAQDPGSVESVDPDEAAEMGASLPDAAR